MKTKTSLKNGFMRLTDLLRNNNIIILYMRGSKTRRHHKMKKSRFANTKKNQYKKYKWISNGTCSSHKHKDLTRKDCDKYFPKSNYIVTGSPHGPPGCWLVLGDHLKGAIKDDKSLKGKGFACWTKKKDGKCSPGFPCVCK